MLDKLQNEFWAALTESDDAVLVSICNEGKLEASDRINIYRTNGRSLHVSVLMSVYPVCEKILGSDYFKQIAKQFYKKYPSHSVDLNQYGDQFSRFLKQLIEQRSELADYQYLADLAKLEWKIQEVYFSADDVKFELLEFQKACVAQAEKMSFSLQASMSVLCSQYPIAEIWQMHQNDAAEQQEVNVDEIEYICIYRDEYQVSLRKITADLFALIEAIKEKKNLSGIAELFEDGYRLNLALEQLIKKNWLRN